MLSGERLLVSTFQENNKKADITFLNIFEVMLNINVITGIFLLSTSQYRAKTAVAAVRTCGHATVGFR